MFLFSKKINLFLLFKALFLKKFNKKHFNKKFKFSNQELILLTRSRWSLLFITFLYKKFINNNQSLNIWVPSYFCNYALSKIRKHYKDVNFIFYPIDDALKIDVKKIKELNLKYSIDIFINVNFFGKSLKNLDLINLLNKKKSWLINDCTHCVSPDNEFEKYSDFTLYSPHKYYSIPSGAVLKINSKGINKKYIKEKVDNVDKLKNEFLRQLELNTFKIYFFDIYCNVLWLIKRTINIFYIKTKIKKIDDKDQEINIELDNKPFPGLIISKLIVNTIVMDTKIISLRKKTLYLWQSIIKKIIKDKFNYNFWHDNINIPYYLILQSDENSIKKIYDLLRLNQIPINTWPDIPPEVKFNKLHHDTYILRNSLIFINLNPQNSAQLKFMNRYEKNSYSIDKNKFSFQEIYSKKEWKNYLNKTNFSYITLLYNYYDNIKFFKSKKFLIKNNFNEIGIFQICYIRFIFGVFVRLNLGPCFFRKIDENNTKEILSAIFFGLFPKKKLFMLMSPNLEFVENNILFQIAEKVYDYSGTGLKSTTIDLTNELKLIKAKLKDNLRRDIQKKKISKKFKIEQIKDTDDFLIFINNYKNEMKKKKFIGANVNLIKNLFLNKELFILNAFTENKLVSSVCVSKHGNTATYLVGLNLDHSRSANDLLLWKMIVLLKKMKCTRFDLGGLDYQNNQAVSIFKSNFNGDDYSLVGSKFLIR